MAEAAENFRVTVPYLALRAFAGLRDSEATLIDWKDIDVTDTPDEYGNFGWITITDEVAKQTDDDDGVRRLVPVRDVLREWLLPHVKRFGRVSPFVNMQKQLTAVARAAKVTCKRNALRHSFISYSVALSADIARVATESGNTPDVIRKHYLRVVKPDLAKLWFEVRPQRPGNVTPMPSGQRSKIDSTSRQCPLGETEPSPVSRSQS